MLIHQCSSCEKLSKLVMNGVDTIPALPMGWTRITIDTSYVNAMAQRHKTMYDLCPECSNMPITFGNIRLSVEGGYRGISAGGNPKA